MLSYVVSDLAGNATTVERRVTVTAVAPTFGGISADRTVLQGTDFDPLEGVTAKDANGLDITDRITYEFGVQAKAARISLPEPGTYPITYFVTDDYGSEATASGRITVTAVDPVDPVDPGAPGDGGDGGVPDDGATDQPTDGASGGATDEPTGTDTSHVTQPDGGLANTGVNGLLLGVLAGLLLLLAGGWILVRRRVV